jgi:Trp operon repressor
VLEHVALIRRAASAARGVMSRLVERRLSQEAAAEALGVSVRQVRRGSPARNAIACSSRGYDELASES